MIEKTISTHNIYEGSRITCKKDIVQLENGKSYTRDVVEHGPAVVILPINQDGELLLVRQYRYAIKDYLLEAPAGAIEHQEDPLAAAKRELKEETGCLAKDWLYCGGMYLAPGFCNEFMHFFCVKDLTFTEPSCDEDEVVSCEWFLPEDIDRLIRSFEIYDAKTTLIYQLAKLHLWI